MLAFAKPPFVSQFQHLPNPPPLALSALSAQVLPPLSKQPKHFQETTIVVKKHTQYFKIILFKKKILSILSAMSSFVRHNLRTAQTCVYPSSVHLVL